MEVSPARHRVVVKEKHRAVDETFVLVQAHLGVLRARVGREKRAAPPGLLRANLRHLAQTFLHPSEFGFVGPLQCTGVARRADANPGVDVLDLTQLEPRFRIQKILGSEFQNVRCEFRIRHAQVRNCARLQDLADERAGKRQRRAFDVQQDVFARLDAGTVADQKLRVTFVDGVNHSSG